MDTFKYSIVSLKYCFNNKKYFKINFIININMNYLYYLQFYFNGIISFLLGAMYTMYIDFSNTALENRTQHIDQNKIINTYKKVTKLVLFNVLVTNLFISFVLFNLIEYLNCSYYFNIYSFPKLFIYKYLVDIPFYMFHKLFHNKYLYKYHKVHHEIKAPIGISAFYQHPIDYIFGNSLPIYIPFILMTPDFISIHIWTFFTIFATMYESHGGFSNLSEFHDLHHKLFKYNFGTNEFMDKLFKTKKVLTP